MDAPASPVPLPPAGPHPSPTEREKWDADLQLRTRAADLAEKAHRLSIRELALKEREARAFKYRSPLVVAILGAAAAAVGNAALALLNSQLQRNAEQARAEEARILEVLKSSDKKAVRDNLKFLVESGLVANNDLAPSLTKYLRNTPDAALPELRPPGVGIVGKDDAVPIDELRSGHPLRQVARSVGRLVVESNGRRFVECTAFLVDTDKVVAPTFCSTFQDTDKAYLLLTPKAGVTRRFEVDRASKGTYSPSADEIGLNVLTVRGNPGSSFGSLKLSSTPPAVGERLSAVYFRGSSVQLAISDAAQCSVVKVLDHAVEHACDSGAGSAGAPLFAADGRTVIGIHSSRQGATGTAHRADTVAKELGLQTRPSDRNPSLPTPTRSVE